MRRHGLSYEYTRGIPHKIPLDRFETNPLDYPNQKTGSIAIRRFSNHNYASENLMQSKWNSSHSNY